jgi:xanthine/CO dehydrogenase XdhC/CoxF family maturation factor
VIERAILEAALALRAAGESFVIATVVAVTGSAYRRPGARMLIGRERWIAGSVSGGCLEGDVMRRGWWQTERNATVVTYDSIVTDDADADALREGLGLGCNGVVDVLLERDGCGGVDVFAFLARCRVAQQRGALVTVFASDDPSVAVGDRLAVDAEGRCEGALGNVTTLLAMEARRAIGSGATTVYTAGGMRALVEVIVPAPRLFVLGAGHDAGPVVALAKQIGWDVIVCAASLRPELRARFARADGIVTGGPADVIALIDASDRAACVVMNHDVARDSACLDAALVSRAAYVGMLGPRHRTAAILDELGRDGRDPRLHAPVGLALGAETPAEIALSIISEIQAALAAAAATSLRECREPIHALRDGAGAGLRIAAACEVTL